MTTTNTYRDLAGQRTILYVRIAKHTDPRLRVRSYTLGEARYAILEDRNGVEFEARIPLFGITADRFIEVSAKIHHVGFDGTVHLKNVRLRKTKAKR